MADLANTAEGTSGNALGATGVGGPDAFDTSTVSGAGTTATFDNAHAHGGSTAIKLHLAAISSTAYVAWTTAITPTPVSNAYARFYLYLTAYPSPSPRIAAFLSGSTVRCTLFMSTSGAIVTKDSAGATIATSTAVVPLNAWCRVEFEVTGISGSTGTVAARIYSGSNLETLTADTNGSLSNAGQAVGGTVNAFRLGVSTASAQAVAWDAWLDNIAFGQTAQLGPLVLAKSSADSSAVADATASASNLPVAETVAVADAAMPTTALLAGDTGTAGDGPTDRAVTGLDTAGAADGPAAFGLTSAESVASTESPVLAASLTASDIGVGLDVSTDRAAATSETATGSDGSADRGASAADSASETDAHALVASGTATDPVAAVDAGSLTAVLISTESASASDSATLSTDTSKSDSETAGSGEAVALSVALSTSDPAAAADSTAFLAAHLVATEAAAAADSVSVAVGLAALDAATTAESAAVAPDVVQVTDIELARAVDAAFFTITHPADSGTSTYLPGGVTHPLDLGVTAGV